MVFSNELDFAMLKYPILLRYNPVINSFSEWVSWSKIKYTKMVIKTKINKYNGTRNCWINKKNKNFQGKLKIN